MMFTLRLSLLIVFAGWFGTQVLCGQEIESRTFGFADDTVERADSIQAVVFQPDPETAEGFLLFLESSQDLESWQVEGLQDYQVNEDGTFVATGADALDRKFWRLRIMHPASQDESEWLAVLKVSRAETSVTAMLTVRTNYYPFIRSYLQYAIDQLPVEWDVTENLEAVDTATAGALQRLLEIAQEVRPADGDYFEVTRPVG